MDQADQRQRPFNVISELQTSCEWTGELDRHLDLNSELGKQLGDCAFAAVGCLYSLACEYFQHRHVHTYECKSCPRILYAATICWTIAQCMKIWPTTSLVPRPIS